MSDERSILRDLTGGRSTPDSIAGRLGMTADAVTAALVTMRLDGLVEDRQIMMPSEYGEAKSTGVFVWQLTDKGHQHINS